jgi:hypothetical protein
VVWVLFQLITSTIADIATVNNENKLASLSFAVKFETEMYSGVGELNYLTQQSSACRNKCIVHNLYEKCANFDIEVGNLTESCDEIHAY